jgi:Bacteriophage probable baseplate hub protein
MPDPNGSAIRVSRPTITIDGEDKPTLIERLLGMEIVERVEGLYRLEAEFGNLGPADNRTGFLFFDRQTIDFGKTVKIKLDSDTIFEGRITGIEAEFPDGDEPRIIILAEDKFQDLRMKRRTRTFDDMSDSDIAGRIAGDHGLTSDVSMSGPTHKVVAQVNQSDLAFLRERARNVDAELWMDGSTLHVQSHSARGGQPFHLAYGTGLREFRVLADLSLQRTSFSVSGWDVAGKSAITHEATASVISSELNGDVSGVSILSSKFGERKEALAHGVPLTSGEAQTAAESYFKLSARRFVVGHGVAETDARFHVGKKAEISAVGPLFSGTYYLTEVRHLFDLTRGIRTEFTAQRPGIGQAP